MPRPPRTTAIKGYAAANNLASLYHHGNGVPKDLRKPWNGI